MHTYQWAFGVAPDGTGMIPATVALLICGLVSSGGVISGAFAGWLE